MGKIIRVGVVAILCVLAVTIVKLCAYSRASYVNEDGRGIVVEIDYGEVRPSRTVAVPWAENRTVLEILQTVAKVETHPVGQHVFVSSIDDVEGKRGEMGWYYMVDGKAADKLAYSKVAKDIEHIKWVYKEDVCSGKVDSGNTAEGEI